MTRCQNCSPSFRKRIGFSVRLPEKRSIAISCWFLIRQGVIASGRQFGIRSPRAFFTINIDHHISNTEYGDLNCVDSTSPATGQILFQLAEAAGWKIDRDIATHLYAAISTDTGSFCYPSTTSETMRIGGALIDAGLDLGETNQMLYENYPRRRVEAMRILLQDLRFDCDGKCASVKLPLSVSENLGLQLGDTEGVIDVIRAIDSVVVAVFFEELPNGKIRVSSRSKDTAYGVGEICAVFGGGGAHPGCRGEASWSNGKGRGSIPRRSS